MDEGEEQSPVIIDYGRAASAYESAKEGLNSWKHAALGFLLLFIVFGWLAMMGIGIWPPDMIVAPRSVLAEQKLPDGNSFQVIQYWNRADFYNTELWHTSPDGVVSKHELDGDDDKTWSVPMRVDTQNRTVAVTLGGNRKREVRW